MTELTKSPRTITVLVVDDSAFMRNALSRMINSDPELKVAGTATDGADALVKIPELDPDVVTLDVEMPGLDGLETLRRLMARAPRPVIMVSSSTLEEAEVTFRALGAGAFDYVPKHLSSTTLDVNHIRHDLIAKIKAAAQSTTSRRDFSRTIKPPYKADAAEPESSADAVSVVAIGSSTGGPKALQQILPLLPADFPVPIVIVQHMPAGYLVPFAHRLDTLCAVSVKQAIEGEKLEPGTIYMAPAGIHMKIHVSPGSPASVCLTRHPDNCLHIPSIDVLMESVAVGFGKAAMGIILSGMGSDGLLGMTAIYRHGGTTIGQNEDTCTVYGMPRACAEAGVLKRILPLTHIPEQLLQATQYRKRT